MADYSAAQINIGGWISRRIVPRLCHAIRQERLLLDWGAAAFEPRSTEELLASRTQIDGEFVLRLCDDQARYGEFDGLEGFLRKHGIPYDRHTEGHYTYTPHLAVYRPATGLQRWSMIQNGEIVLPAMPLWDVPAELYALKRMAMRGLRKPLLSRLHEILAVLEESIPERPTTLPPLEIGKSVALRNAA